MRNNIVEEARKYLGVRYRHQGRNMHGLDCAGLIIVVGNKLGLMDYDITNYPRRSSGDTFCGYFVEAGFQHIPLHSALPGDVVLTRDRDLPCHCGFVSEKRGKLSFIHSTLMRRKVVEEPLEYWEPKVTATLRFPSLMES